MADLDPWGGSKPQGWAGSAPRCLHVCIFMVLLTPDHLIRLNFVFIMFLKYHLRNLSFLGYSQCLFLGQRRPALHVAMPHHLFSCCLTGVFTAAVAASFHRADSFLGLCLVCCLTVQPEVQLSQGREQTPCFQILPLRAASECDSPWARAG